MVGSQGTLGGFVVSEDYRVLLKRRLDGADARGRDELSLNQASRTSCSVLLEVSIGLAHALVICAKMPISTVHRFISLKDPGENY